MPPPAIFGIESSGLNLAVDLLVLFVVVLYLSLIYWTYSDARRRILDPMLVGCATVGVAVPVRRHDRLRDPAPARISRGRARARTRDAGRRSAAASSSTQSAVPALRLPGRDATSSAARAACASSRSAASAARARSTRHGRSARTARPTCPGSRSAETPAQAAAPATSRTSSTAGGDRTGRRR